MKRYVYIAACVVIGLIVSTLVHAALEVPILLLVTENVQYQDNVLWQNWEAIHGTGAAILWILGLVLGAWAGVKSWPTFNRT